MGRRRRGGGPGGGEDRKKIKIKSGCFSVNVEPYYSTNERLFFQKKKIKRMMECVASVNFYLHNRSLSSLIRTNPTLIQVNWKKTKQPKKQFSWEAHFCKNVQIDQLETWAWTEEKKARGWYTVTCMYLVCVALCELLSCGCVRICFFFFSRCGRFFFEFLNMQSAIFSPWCVWLWWLFFYSLLLWCLFVGVCVCN